MNECDKTKQSNVYTSADNNRHVLVLDNEMDDKKLTALAAKAITGDEAAFEELYLAHARSILFHVRSLIFDKQNYNDVAQDVALRMHAYISQLREPAAFRGWMHQIIRSVCFNHNKQVGVGEKYLSTFDDDEALEALEDVEEQSDPEAVTLAMMEGNKLFAIVSDLPLNYRETIMLRYYDDLSYKEIAEAQGISVTNVSTRLQRALEALRKKIGEMGEGYGTPDKGTAMKESNAYQQDIPQETPERTELLKAEETNKKYTEGIKLKPALYSGVALLIPEDAIKTFASSVGTKIAAATTTAAVASTTATTGVFKYIPTIIIAAISTITLIFAAAVGLTAVSSLEGSDTANTGEITGQSYELDYSGSAHLAFVDENGGESDLDVVSITLVEDVPASVETTWQLYALAAGEAISGGEEKTLSSGATLIGSGSGTTLDSVLLADLAPGVYHAVFMLTDSNGATAEAARSFTIS